MSLGTVLQTIVGTIFIYLILALLVSEIQEQFAALMQFRARNLKKSIQILLKNEKSLTESLYKHSKIASLSQYTNQLLTRRSAGASYIPKEVFAQALLDVLLTRKLKPAFTEFDILDLELFSEKINNFDIDEATKQLLKELIRLTTIKNPKATFEDFKKELENLFDQAQERTSGVYKRNAKGVSLMIGLIIAVISNADTFNIVSKLSKNTNNISSTIASRLTEKQQELQCSSDLNEQEYEKCVKDLAPQLKGFFDNINAEVFFPLGWDFAKRLSQEELDKKIKNKDLLMSKLEGTIQCFKNTQQDEDKEDCFEQFLVNLEDEQLDLDNDDIQGLELQKFNSYDVDWNNYQNNLKNYNTSLKANTLLLKRDKIVKVNNQDYYKSIMDIIDEQGGFGKVGLGWWISAIAISMGAPFWFDLLGKVINVRNTGRPSSPPNNPNSGTP
jgi:hypothetical protein